MDCFTSVLSSSHALPAYTCWPKSKVPAEGPFSHFTGVIRSPSPGSHNMPGGSQWPHLPSGCHRQKAQGLGRTVVSYETVEAVPTSPAHTAKVTGKHKAGDTALVHGTYWDIPEVPLYYTYPGHLGRSRVLSRLSRRIRPSSADKSFGIVSRALGWSKFGMCAGRGG